MSRLVGSFFTSIIYTSLHCLLALAGLPAQHHHGGIWPPKAPSAELPSCGNFIRDEARLTDPVRSGATVDPALLTLGVAAGSENWPDICCRCCLRLRSRRCLGGAAGASNAARFSAALKYSGAMGERRFCDGEGQRRGCQGGGRGWLQHASLHDKTAQWRPCRSRARSGRFCGPKGGVGGVRAPRVPSHRGHPSAAKACRS